MNMEEVKRCILLKQSGELSLRRQRRLERFLATSEEAQAFERELLQMAKHTRDLEVPDIPGFQLHRILDEARARDRAERAPAGASRYWRPALAYAAVALLAVAGWLMFSKPPSTQMAAHQATPENGVSLAWQDDIDEQLDALGEQFASVGEGLADYDESAVTLEEIAAELLELEGSEI